ncbi:vWA domain-containing protein [Aquimonas voraii]|uniref:Ca-activated chloride channel family protein n=1 Tax=Aquimonas voraii TaxID=265719 RepID=A0A1G6WS51_9GAMM|nr:VWA domain-containing protein [Aquimonas voraii]SDD68760.1 Ca-activated chloride channel family protein [Aquimonas voraii]
MLRVALLSAALSLSFAAAAEERVVLVLDASGSMWGQIEGRSKIEIARETVAGLVRDWKPANALGLVAYGHRRKGDCADIETLIESGPLDADGFLRQVNALNPKGMTPLSAAVVQAAESLRHVEQKATVILVSDGEETCNLDPCQVGRELEAAGVDFTAHVIGFDVANPQHQAQLRCLAENTGGRYFNARNADELSGALGAVVAVSTEPAPPPASASLESADEAPAAASVSVSFTGPADRGDFIGLYRAAAAANESELRYAWVENAEDGRVQVATPAEAGRYELRYVSPVRDYAVLAQRPLTVTDVGAAIEAPAEVSAGTRLTVRARGPEGSGHWVGFAKVGSAPGAALGYARPTGPESELELMVPAEPGDYELRYVLNESERVLVSRPIKVLAASVYVRGPAEVPAGGSVEVEAAGPIDGSHWIGFAPAGSNAGSYRDYVRPAEGQTRYTLRAPGEPGDYELRYVLNESEAVAARQPIRVVAAQVRIEAPASAPAGSAVAITVEGPAASGSWIGFAPVGAGDGAWEGQYADFDSSPLSVELTAPEGTGAYEIKLVSSDGKVLARRPITLR